MSLRDRPFGRAVLHAVVEAFEPRRLFSFARLDPSFGGDGIATAATSGGSVYDDRVSPLNDGGSIVRIGDRQFRRFDARGERVDRFGGGDATINLSGKSRAILSAVDARTGRVAVIAANGALGASKLNLYGARGDLERSVANVELGTLKLANVTHMSFDASGRLLLAAAADRTVARMLPATGRLDPKFAGDGIAALGATAGTSGNGAVGLAVGPGDAVTLVRYSYTETPGLTSYHLDVDRFDAKGRRVAAFGGAGHASTQVGSLTRTTSGPIDSVFDTTSVDDVAAAPDGSLYLIQRRSSIRITDAISQDAHHFELRQVRDDGTFAAPIDLSGRFRPDGDDLRHRVLVDGAGRVYAVSRSEVVRLDARRRFDAAYNGASGAASISASMGVFNDATLDAAGRLLVLGRSNDFSDSYDPATSLRAYAGSVEGFGTPTGRATLLADGTLDVNGTADADAVRVRLIDGRLRVDVNDRTQFFAPDRVRGIVVHTGAGHDNVRVEGPLYGVSVQGGAGDDRLTGGDFLDGGDGNDYLDGRDNNDHLTGRAGDDTLRGSEGTDRLDGGAGDDVIFGSDEVGTDDFMYFAGNTLIGGAGVDRLVASRHDESKGRFDVLADRASEDIVG